MPSIGLRQKIKNITTQHPHIMRHIATFFTFIAVFFTTQVSAQQWESFLSPPFPLQNSKLVALEGNLFAFVSTGLYRSQDGGEHWTQIRSYTSDNVAQVLEINRNNKRLYWSEGLDTMGFYQLFSSADLGNSWQAIGNVQAGVSAFISDTISRHAWCFHQANTRKISNPKHLPRPELQAR
jgi:hypothetical protein